MNGDEILKAALLGTDRYVPQPSVALLDIGSGITALQTDKEDRFLKLAIAMLLYEEAGRKPIIVTEALSECPEETLPTISEDLEAKIKYSLSAREEVLFHYFLHLANSRGQVFSPQLAPLVLNKALEHKKMAQPMVAACGEVGKWLCLLNDNWQVLMDTDTGENVWETGSVENRIAYFVRVRTAEPTRALEMLRVIIGKENAANRAVFVELLQDGISLRDEPFLQEMLNDKSTKVKNVALSLLRSLPGSAINGLYTDHLLGSLSVKEERYLLIAKRKVLTIDENVPVNETLLDTGIEKVSAEKGVKDGIHIIRQLLGFACPAILAHRLNVSEAELLQLLLQHTEAATLRPYLATAATRHHSSVWARMLLDDNVHCGITILDALPAGERIKYYDKFIDTQLPSLLTYLLDDGYTTLPLALAQKILTGLSKRPYEVMQPVYQRLALHLPVDLLPQLRSYTISNTGDYQERYFIAQVTEMLRIMDIKNNTN